jgi:phenylalanine ammonia-lyase
MIQTLPTEQYNQDMVSLGTHSAVTAMDMTALAREAVAMVLIALCQAIDLRRAANYLGKGNQAIYATVRSEVTFLDEDRPLDRDIAKVGELIQKRLIPLPDWRAGP